MNTNDYLKDLAALLKKNPVDISCIIPAYNEEGRISEVLKVVSDFPHFMEIVIVNDGSTDGTTKEVMDFIDNRKNIRFFDNKENHGKTAALIQGIQEAKGDLIALVDADLRNFTHQDIARMLFFVVNGEFDMTIIDRGGDRLAPTGFIASLINRINGGERAFWKDDFAKVVFRKDDGYLFEQVINLHYVKNEMKVRTIYCPDLRSAWQWSKKGFLKGWKVYVKMFIDLYKNSRVKGFYLQVGGIEEDRLEPLYKLYKKSKDHKKLKIVPLLIIIIVGIITSTFTFFKLNILQLKPNPKALKEKLKKSSIKKP